MISRKSYYRSYFINYWWILLLKVDDWFGNSNKTDISYLTALKIGLFQCLAMIPGVSRSGASIVGGMTQKLSRTTAEFSFS